MFKKLLLLSFMSLLVVSCGDKENLSATFYGNYYQTSKNNVACVSPNCYDLNINYNILNFSRIANSVVLETVNGQTIELNIEQQFKLQTELNNDITYDRQTEKVKFYTSSTVLYAIIGTDVYTFNKK